MLEHISVHASSQHLLAREAEAEGLPRQSGHAAAEDYETQSSPSLSESLGAHLRDVAPA